MSQIDFAFRSLALNCFGGCCCRALALQARFTVHHQLPAAAQLLTMMGYGLVEGEETILQVSAFTRQRTEPPAHHRRFAHDLGKLILQLLGVLFLFSQGAFSGPMLFPESD